MNGLHNPLIATTTKETAQNVSEAFDAIMILLAVTNSPLCRLLTPLQAALDYLAEGNSSTD